MLDILIEALGLFTPLSVFQERDHGNCIVVYRPVVPLLSCTWKNHTNCHERVQVLEETPIFHRLIHSGDQIA